MMYSSAHDSSGNKEKQALRKVMVNGVADFVHNDIERETLGFTKK